ncbi:hypothetical protein L7F22_038259 [Adiantum nelumboides]|nr:hypothetical protein [Adiantum nelumboides]
MEGVPRCAAPCRIFCQTKKDFNNHYGLNTEGKDPRLLKDSDVLEGDWLSVFSHSRDTSFYRVKCSSIRQEQYEDLLIFYMKVYQKRPMNMEVNVSFARAYVLQFSPRAVKAGRSVQFAWAIVGEEHNNDLKKSGHFHTHYLRWKVINGAGDSIVGIVNVEEPNIELTPPPPIAPLASHSLSVLTVAKDEHATCLKKLEAGKVQQLSDEKFGKALSLLDEQISATKLKLAFVAEDDPVTRIQLASQLEAQESMQAKVEFLADVVKEKEMQHILLQEMLHRVEVGRRAYICPPPPSVMSPTLDNFTLPTKCAGCKYGHNVKEALMLVVLPCKHTYYSLCFATLCAFTDQCMVQYCSMAIPRDAQSTVIWGDVMDIITGSRVKLLVGDMVVANGFIVTTQSDGLYHGVLIGHENVIVAIQDYLYPNWAFPFSTMDASTTGEAINSVVKWGRASLQVVRGGMESNLTYHEVSPTSSIEFETRALQWRKDIKMILKMEEESHNAPPSHSIYDNNGPHSKE